MREDYYRYNYRNCIMFVEHDHYDDCVKRFHTVIDRGTGQRHSISHSPYTDPTVEEFKAIVDRILGQE